MPLFEVQYTLTKTVYSHCAKDVEAANQEEAKQKVADAFEKSDEDLEQYEFDVESGSTTNIDVEYAVPIKIVKT